MVAVCYSSSSPRPIVVLVVVVLLPPLVHVVPASSAAGVYACVTATVVAAGWLSSPRRELRALRL
jgi:hypothetical protein